MNEKITLQYLIEALTKRHQMDPKDADMFVKAFFELIRHGLERDKYIKIKGLGTFKRIESDSRGSDSKEGDEHTEGQSHFRITFTPDVSMRDTINKPFAHFETVVLNEHTHFDDMDEEGMGPLSDGERLEDVSDSLLDRENPSVEAIDFNESVGDSEVPIVEPEETSFPDGESKINIGYDKTLSEEFYEPEQPVVLAIGPETSIPEIESEGQETDCSEICIKEAEEESTTRLETTPELEDRVFEVQKYEKSDEEMPEPLVEEIVRPEVQKVHTSNDEECTVPLSEILEQGVCEKEKSAVSVHGQREEDLSLSHESESVAVESEQTKQDIHSVASDSFSGSPDKKSQKAERGRIPWCMYATILLVGVLIGGGVIWALLSGRRYIPESLLRELISEKKVNHEMAASKALEKSQNIVPAIDSAKTDSIEQQLDSMAKRTVNLTLPTVSSSVPSPAIKSSAPAKDDKPQTVKRETLADTMEYTIIGTMDTYTLQNGESLVKVALKYYGNKKLWPYIVRHNRKIIKNPDNVPVGTTLQIPKLSPKK